MHRCHIDTARWTQDRIVPSPGEAHHLLHVLRARDGDTVRIFNGAGLESVAVLRSAAGGEVALEVRDALASPERGMDIVLVQAVLKGSRMELLIEKATELGVSRIIPAVTQRSIPRFDPAQARQKKERWERISVSAAKQCGTRWLPVIELPRTLDAALQDVRGAGPALLASLGEGTRPLAEVIDELRAAAPRSVAVIIGPEGDLAPEETHRLLAAGCVPVSLGHLTLRAETAAIFAVSALSCMLPPAK